MNSAASSARSSATGLRSNRGFQIAARVGFAMNGVLHVLIGIIAISVAIGGSGSADQSGALGQLSGNPAGQALLWVVTVGLWALGLFQLLSAIAGGEAKERISDAGKGVAYLAVGFSAFTFARGGSSDSSEQSKGLSATLLSAPAGVVLLVVIGLAIVAIGVYFVVKGARQKFRDDITVPGGTVGTAVVATGTTGYIAKGIAIGVVGILFIAAAVTADPDKSTGLDGALKTLAGLPFGVLVLIVVAIGLIAFGAYSFLRARYGKL